MSTQPNQKPIVGITCGDINGIGPEIIIKSLSDNRINEWCVPVVFGNSKLFSYYRKGLQDFHFNFTQTRDLSKLNTRQTNLVNVWEEEANIQPGELTADGGRYAAKSLMEAAAALKNGSIDILVTAPVHKNNIYGEEFPFTGHTPFLKSFFEQKDVLMLMAAGNFRMGLVTEHIPISAVAGAIDRASIVSKLMILKESLKRDFDISRPKVAVLALNPHAGDQGLVGKEEEEIIRPAIKEAKQHNLIVEGPFAADGFFARYHHLEFDAVLAMYHDQGLIPFKSLAQEEGINYTAGLPFVRTSPDHGTAFDIAGRNVADFSSLNTAIFEGIEIFKTRFNYDDSRKNPLKRTYVNTGVDEKIEEGNSGR